MALEDDISDAVKALLVEYGGPDRQFISPYVFQPTPSMLWANERHRRRWVRATALREVEGHCGWQTADTPERRRWFLRHVVCRGVRVLPEAPLPRVVGYLRKVVKFEWRGE